MASNKRARSPKACSTKVKKEKSDDPVPIKDEPVVILRTLREVTPADYLFQIKSFSLLSETEETRFESGDFESGGYKWKLCLYPNGFEKENGKGHISLYLAISETDTLPRGWEVNVKFDFFVYDHVRDKYLTIQYADGSVRRFHRFKTEFGFAKLLSLDTFREASNGYLIDDSCVFGAEIYVIKSTGRGECLSLKEQTCDNSYTWEIKSFSEIKEKELVSESFTIGKLKWKISVYPKGNGSEEGKSLSVFLNLTDCGSLPTKRKLYAEFSLQVKDRVNGKHCEIKGDSWFCDQYKSWGFDAISLTDLHDTTKGFIVQDSLVVEVQIHVMSDVKEFS